MVRKIRITLWSIMLTGWLRREYVCHQHWPRKDVHADQLRSMYEKIMQKEASARKGDGTPKTNGQSAGEPASVKV